MTFFILRTLLVERLVESRDRPLEKDGPSLTLMIGVGIFETRYLSIFLCGLVYPKSRRDTMSSM